MASAASTEEIEKSVEVLSWPHSEEVATIDRSESPEAPSPTTSGKENGVFAPAPEEVEKYIEVLFQSVYEDLITEEFEASEATKKWQTALHYLIRSRLEGVDPTKQTWETIASQLCITADEAHLMLHRYPCHQREEKKDFVLASVNKTNYLINLLLGHVSTNRYIGLERPAFDKDDPIYTEFLLSSINELLDSSECKAMYSRFFLAAKLKCVNDAGRLPRSVDLQATENMAFMKRVQALRDGCQESESMPLIEWMQTSERDGCRGAENVPFVKCMQASERDRRKDQLWSDKYGFILVFGTSPLCPYEKLSEASIVKADECIALSSPEFSTNFIACGTATRPFGTAVIEAYELKQYMMLKGNVPEDRILVEATSEHTFSNIWNSALLAFAAGMPFDKKMIAFLPHWQFDFIMGLGEHADGGMRKRCKEEICPDLYEYLSVESGEVENSIVVGFKEAFRHVYKGRLQWKNYIGRNIEVEEI
ncbi:hypothetical protein BDZ45DRAFT_770784 [Acephala macrosclerotiorum]|nr:hypothetical protein BDZ45DRAFT_770784 [Acephala macrosclerotiorum]